MPTELWWFIGGACVQLLLAGLLLRARRPRPVNLAPSALALLRGGTRAAVTVALVALHQRGAVAAARRRTIRANGGPGATRDPLQRGVHASLYRAIGLGALANRPRTREAVDALRAELCLAGLLRAPGRRRAARVLLGLVPVTLAGGLAVILTSGGAPPLAYALAAAVALASVPLWRVPCTTAEARRALADERARHPLPAHRRDLADGTGAAERIQLYVALYGDAALRLFYPHFARDGGLLGPAGAASEQGPRWKRVQGLAKLRPRASRESAGGGYRGTACGSGCGAGCGGGCGGGGGGN